MSRRNVNRRRPQASKRSRDAQGAALEAEQGTGGTGYWVRSVSASDRLRGAL